MPVLNEIRKELMINMIKINGWSSENEVIDNNNDLNKIYFKEIIDEYFRCTNSYTPTKEEMFLSSLNMEKVPEKYKNDLMALCLKYSYVFHV